MGKHCNNPQSFKEKNYETKSTKTILEKKKRIKKFIKKNHVGKHCSNPYCFKEKNYRTKFSTNSILKKIYKDNLKKT